MTLEQAAERATPHDLAAEQRVLGALLIDRDAIFKVADLLRAEDFYQAKHQRVYRAAQALLERRERIDPLTMQVELARNEVLDQVGGAAYLRELVATTPTAVDVERHARVVRDRSLLRRLLNAAKDIAADAYDEPADVTLTLDRAEQRIFSLRDEAINAQLRHIQAALMQNYDHITERMEHPFEVSGIPSGFREIDAYTEGFTRGDLVILAARPSVGKTSLGLAIAHHVAKRGTGVLIFSLEMDTKQIVARFLGLNSRTDLLALRTGNIRDTEAASALAGLPVLIDDTPGISIMELRTKARRAIAQAPGGLGIILVDYLQLIRTGEHEENRVQELATITRNLKSLARELDVTIVALSQLSRAAGDAGNEPKLSTLRECVTGDTIVSLSDGRRVPIQELVGTTPEVLSIDARGRLARAISDKVWSVGRRPVFEVKLASGRSIRATAEHRLYGFRGWRTVSQLQVDDRLAIARAVPEPEKAIEWPDRRVALLGQLIGDGSYIVHQPLRYTNSTIANVECVTEAAAHEFGTRVSCTSHIGDKQEILISGNGNRWHPAGVNLWLRELGIFGQHSYEKRVPREVFRLHNRQIALLLKHLWATDGSITARKPGSRGSHTVYYSTNSPGLAFDVAALLLRIGIVARTIKIDQENYLPGYQVHLTGCEAQRLFLSTVGAFGPRVAPALLLSAAIATTAANTNVDTLPREVFNDVRTLMAERGITYRAMTALRGTSNGGTAPYKFSPSRALVAEYADLLDSEALATLATTDLFWDRVIAISPTGEEHVYDLTVPATSSWLADGIVSHNSGAIEQDSDQVVMLWKDKDETPPGAPRLIRGSIAKNRNGPTGRFELYFEAEQARFFSRSDDEGMPV
ncbi:MAG TPA: replicative DNA helicase [Candidatus Limnocylindria bacterium]|nr:replicative DNA helicase [Candidatus Limnocylindria bacterium]